MADDSWVSRILFSEGQPKVWLNHSLEKGLFKGGQDVLFRGRKPIVTTQEEDIKVEAMKDLGEKIGEVDINKKSREQGESFKNVKGAGGYRWMRSQKPTICIPGVPNVWVGGKIGQTGTDDKLPGARDATDFNATKLGRKISYLEPILSSLIDPSMLDNIQLITPRRCLLSLYHFLGGKTIYEDNKGGLWRIDARLIGNKAIFHTWKSPGELVKPAPQPAKSYFKKATETITPEADINTDADRLVRYTFDGIPIFTLSQQKVEPMIINFTKAQKDALGQVPSDTSDKENDNTQPSRPSSPSSDDTVVDTAYMDFHKKKGKEELKAALNQFLKPRAIAPPIAKSVMPRGRHIDIEPGTYDHPAHDTLVEVRTRKIDREMDLQKMYGQMVFSQTVHLHIAKHDHHDYSKHSVERHQIHGPIFNSVRQESKDIIRKVAGVLKEMLDAVKGRGEITFLFYGNTMEISERMVKLPKLSAAAREMLEGAN